PWVASLRPNALARRATALGEECTVRRTKIVIAVSLGFVLVPAAAASGPHTPTQHGPLRVWSFDEITAEGLEFSHLDGASQQGGRLRKHRNFGTTLFNPSAADDRPGIADGDIFSSASGKTFG